RRERPNDADAALEIGNPPVEGRRVGRRQAGNGEARQSEAGDVDLLDRAARILETVDVGFCDELEARGAQLLEQGAQRDPLLPGAALEIREGEARDGDAAGAPHDRPDAGDGLLAARGGPGDADL